MSVLSLVLEHMMTESPSCQELEVIPNTGKRNSKERAIRQTLGRPPAASHSQPEQQRRLTLRAHVFRPRPCVSVCGLACERGQCVSVSARCGCSNVLCVRTQTHSLM